MMHEFDYDEHLGDEYIKMVSEMRQKRREVAEEKRITEAKANGTYMTPEEILLEEQKRMILCDKPGTMDDELASVLYGIVMAAGIIFKDRLLIWFGASVVYFCFKFRKEIRLAKFNRDHNIKNKEV